MGIERKDRGWSNGRGTDHSRNREFSHKFSAPSGLLRRMIGRNRATMAGLVIVCLFLGVAALAPILTHYDPERPDLAVVLRPPSLAHPFGTDEMGRDVLTRVFYGARVSLRVIVVTLTIAGAVGVFVGALSGYAGGAVDEVLMRLTDAFLAFPALILTLAIGAALGPSIEHAMAAVGAVWWPLYARLTRGQVLALKDEEFVEAARSLGLSPLRIVLRPTGDGEITKDGSRRTTNGPRRGAFA